MRMRLLALTALLLAVAWPASAQTGSVMPVPRQQFLDNNGNPCAGCKLYTFTSGTLTPLDTYSDVTLMTANAQPIVLNSAGRPSVSGVEITVFLSATSYKFELDSAADVPIWVADTVSATNAGLTGLSNTGDIVFQVDTNNDGSNVFSFTNGTSVQKAALDESGNLQIDGNLTVGDATEADKAVLFDGNAQDFHIGVDDSADALVIGRGIVLGTTPAVTIASSGAITVAGATTFSGAGVFSSTLDVGGTVTLSTLLNVSGVATLGAADSTVKIGASTETAKLGGVINVDSTQQGTAANTSDTALFTYALPANALNANGRVIRVTAWGSFGANGNTKTVRIKWNGIAGTTVVATSSSVNNQNWILTGTVVRTGSNTQDVLGYALVSSPSQDLFATFGTSAATDSGAIDIVVSAQNGSAAANDIRYEGSIIEFLN